MDLPPAVILAHERWQTVRTHFSEGARMVIRLALSQSEVQADKDRHVRHVQGVDTVLLPTSLLDKHEAETLLLHPSVFVHLLHTSVFPSCPDAFFQDDYVISLLFHLAEIYVLSAWNNDHVAKHVEGVSKSNSQLHMKDSVFEREEATKVCLTRQASNIYRESLSIRRKVDEARGTEL